MSDSENKQEITENQQNAEQAKAEENKQPAENKQAENKPQEAKPEPKKHSNLFLRVVSVVVLLPLVILLIVFGAPWMWAAFLAAAGFIGALEFMRITNGSESTATRTVSAVLSMIPAVAAYIFVGEHAPMPMPGHELIILGGATAVTVWGAFLFNCFRPREIPKASSVINSTLGATLYIGFLFLVLALFKRDFANGNAWIFTLMAMTWCSDTGAYFCGRAFGKHKMAPILSPKKSIEGAVGGFTSAVIAAIAAKFIAFPDISLPAMIGLAVGANFLAQMGDLSESLLKRSHGIKDSGNIIPGHGGMLDRVDALIFSAPWVYGFAYFMN